MIKENIKSFFIKLNNFIKERIKSFFIKLNNFMEKKVNGIGGVIFLLLLVSIFEICVVLNILNIEDKYNIISNIYHANIIILIPYIALFLCYRVKQERKQKIKETIDNFGIKCIKKYEYGVLSSFVAAIFFYSSLVLFVFFIATTQGYPYSKVENTVDSLGQFGDYIGGVVGTIVAAIICCAAFFTLWQQREYNRISQKEANQTQFENRLLQLLQDLKNDIDNQDKTQFYLLLRLIYYKIYSYADMNRENKEYIIETSNITVVSYLGYKMLYEMFYNKDILCPEEKLYENIRNIIEKNGLFEYLHQVDENFIEFYDKSAYGENEDILSIYQESKRVDIQSKSKDEIKKIIGEYLHNRKSL